MVARIATKAFRPRNVGQTVEVYASEAGDIFHLDCSGMFRLGQANFGLSIQANGTTVTPAITQADPKVAMDPSNTAAYANVPWQSRTAVTTGNIGKLDGDFATVLRLTFTGVGMALVSVM